MPGVDLQAILIVGAAALMVGLAKGGLGGVAGALLVPLLSTIMPITQAVGVVLPLLMVGDVFALRAYWRTWELKYVRLMLPGAVVGIVMGILLLTSLSDDALRRVLGIFTLVVAAYKIASDSLSSLAYSPRNWHGVLAGWSAGAASALANAGGPPVTAYLLLQKVPPLAFVGTQTLFFAAINALKLPGFLTAHVIDLPSLLGVLWALPIIPVGVWIGKWIIVRLNQRVFEWLMLILLVYAGVSLLAG
jgi:uncharacterized membrane protein YfcA